tara:strand:- start:2570 stop:2764 length:195 start_codon:yes stop_codon:yes gene_type:complete
MNPESIVNPEYPVIQVALVTDGHAAAMEYWLVANAEQINRLEESIIAKAFEKYCNEKDIEKDGE